MAAKKKPVGCALGCMGLLVIGGGIGILGVAGGGAWMWLGLDSSAISFDGADLGSLVPHELSETPSVEDDAMADVGDQPADQPEVEADDGSDEADAARIALEQALAMEAAIPAKPQPTSSGGGSSSASSSGSSSSSSSSASSSSGGGSSSSSTRPSSSSSSASSSSGGGSSSSQAPSSAPVSSGGSDNVTVSGPATVVLVSGGSRHPVPGNVPAGKYDIEATFSGDSPVTVGTITVSSGGARNVHCSARMGTCRVQ